MRVLEDVSFVMRSPHLNSRALLFFCLYTCVIVYLSLYPWKFLPGPRYDGLIWVPFAGRHQILDAVLNFFFYVPLGAAGVFAVRRRGLGWALAISIGCALSFVIENLQLWSISRYSTWDDFATNSAGTIMGATAAYWILHTLEGSHYLAKAKAQATHSRWALPATSVLLLILWITAQAFPFVPAIALTRLTQIVSLTTWSWQTAAEAFLGFAVLRVAAGNSPWLLVAYAMLPAQAFLVDRALSGAALLGAALGYAASQTAGIRIRVGLAFALPALLVFEELRPFQFALDRQAINWAPFDTWFSGSRSSYYPVIFGKLYLYTAAIWVLRNVGWRWQFAIGLPLLILAGGEWAQQYIPGRTPETTDVVVVLLGAVLLGLCSRNEERITS